MPTPIVARDLKVGDIIVEEKQGGGYSRWPVVEVEKRGDEVYAKLEMASGSRSTFSWDVSDPLTIQTPVLVLRSLTLTKEEAAVARVLFAAAIEARTDLLSTEGHAVLRSLTLKVDETLRTFPA